MNELISKEPIKLKECKTIDEKRIQKFISENPKVLNIGNNLELVQREVRQNGGGYLDILLQDDDTRYEVEVQLGATDPSHIIRTIEYWNNEKRRTPDMSHIPVLVAEEITGRFLGVISLFNKSIPMIAIQMNVFKENNNDYGILFTKIIDLSENDSDDDLGGNVVSKEDWEKKSTKDMISLVDKIFVDLMENKNNVKINYLQNYIGLIINDMSDNVVSFVPKKNFINMRFKSQENEKIEKEFKEKGIEITYCSRLGRKDYTFKVIKFEDYQVIKENLKDIIKDKM